MDNFLIKKIKLWLNQLLETISKNLSSSSISRNTIVSITKFINDFLYHELQENEMISNRVREHIIYIFNDALIKIKDYELTYKETKDLFDNLRRLYIVTERYKKNKRKSDADRIVALIKEAEKIL